VIVTDHHDLGDHLPDVGALVNPRRLPNNHALASLPGVGIAYKLMQHVYTMRNRERELPRLLDLVALGIVGDVATQTADTRYLLQIGLERLRRTERIGLQALMEVARLIPDKLTAEQIGYQLSPRLNAAGRLGDASLAVELLTTRNRSRAVVLAQQLEGFNSERRTRTEEIEAAAEQMITPSVLESEALVLYHPKWHPGIMGIVAARLAERYGRPAVLLADGENGLVRGSARSAAGYDISKALAAVDDLLHSYGGHPGAAGLSLEIGKVDLFRARFSQTLQGMAGTDTDRLNIDAIVGFAELTPDLVGRIHRLAPFGEGNPPITLATRNVRLNRAAVVGFTKQHRRLVIEDEDGRQQTFIWWRGAKDALPDGTFDVAYQATRSETGGGQAELQLTLVDLRLHADAAGAEQAPTIQLTDWRRETDPLVRLEALLRDEPDAQVWAEAYSRQKFPNWKRRAELTPASSLIIYTAPADPRTLYEVLERVQPQSAHVLAVASPLRNLDAFLAQLTVAAKNVIEHLGGKAHPEILCGATAQSPQVVRAGLEFLVASGKLGSIQWRNRANVQIAAAVGEQARTIEEDLTVVRTRLEAAYREVEAFRRYFRTAPLEQLLLPDSASPVRPEGVGG
jgi:single-stranded-DNA-specific exonuclease